MLLVMSMEESGVGYDNIDAKSLGGVGSGLTALNEGGIDAAVILEPIWTKVSEKYKPAFHVNDYLPPITQTVGVVRSDFIEGNEEMLSGIVEARRRGVEFIYENPEVASTLLAKAYDMDPAVAETALKNVAELEYWSRGDYEFEGMNNMIRGLQLVGAIEEGEFDWSGLVTDAFLPDDLKSE
jgi:NitT/TauT family transport system substrate-binding protein